MECTVDRVVGRSRQSPVRHTSTVLATERELAERFCRSASVVKNTFDRTLSLKYATLR